MDSFARNYDFSVRFALLYDQRRFAILQRLLVSDDLKNVENGAQVGVCRSIYQRKKVNANFEASKTGTSQNVVLLIRARIFVCISSSRIRKSTKEDFRTLQWFFKGKKR
ncbi:MAG: hypothetical protein AAF847_18190 [Bacteroidota bacterium]